jgi:hypothetical protein
MAGSLNNPVTNLLNSIVGNAKGIFTGTNPLTQPVVGQLLGFNIQGTPLISTRDYFLLQLESWLTSIPLQSQWIILINPFPGCINSDILRGLEATTEPAQFDVDQSRALLTAYPFQKVNGCLFAQEVQVPGESMNIQKAGVTSGAQRGFLPGIISAGRNLSNTLNIQFLETNTSFTDFIIRPWLIAAEHFGFVAKEKDSIRSRDLRNVKSTMYVLEYSRTYQNVSMIPKKVWTFYNCAPISINSRTLGYIEPTTAPTITTQWTYTNYAISNALYLPLPDIINRITNAFEGKFPTISPLQGGKNNGNYPQTLLGNI